MRLVSIRTTAAVKGNLFVWTKKEIVFIAVEKINGSMQNRSKNIATKLLKSLMEFVTNAKIKANAPIAGFVNFPGNWETLRDWLNEH